MAEAMFNPDLRRKIKVRMRPDLVITQQRYNGQMFHIIKDPVALRYYRFREEELFLLQQLDGNNTFDDIRHEFVEQYRPSRLSVAELEKFVAQLLQAGIATAQTPQVGQRLFEKSKKNRRDKFKKNFSNILYLKLPVFDPEQVLNRMIPYTSFLFTIPFLLMVMTFGISSLLLLLVNWQTFVSKLPTYQEFFTPRNLLFFWATLGIVKVLHEFGHGLSCKKFGGEVHEMGILLLVLTPCLYCNVSDSWMLPNKWHRVTIGAAGMYIELILSSMFVWIWWYSEPGLLNTLSLSIIFICSVSTILFNANPLLRFDGYYILSDIMEIPNMRERSNKYLGNVASKFFFGAEAVDDPFMPKERKSFFITYAIAAYLYRWVITFSIIYMLTTFLKPYKLMIVGYMLIAMALIPLAILPVYRMIKTVKNRWRKMKVNKIRMVSAFAAAALVLAAVLLIPFPMRIHAPLILQAREAKTIFVKESGTLEELNVEDSDAVTATMVLARLRDRELEKEMDRLNVEHLQLIKAKKLAHAIRDFGEAYKLGEQIKTNRKTQELHSDHQQKLILHAEQNGIVLSPPKPTDLGKLFESSDVFCQIGDPQNLEAYIVVEQTEIELVREDNHKKGRPVWLKFSGHVGEIRQWKVEEISHTNIEAVPPALSNKNGGEVATTTDSEQKIEVPAIKSYAVQVPVDNLDGSLFPGVRGIARFDVGYRSLYWRLKRFIQTTFHFRL